MALLPVFAEFSRHRRIDGQPGHHRHLRDDSPRDIEFGQEYANELRRRQSKREDKWHLDEVVLTIKGRHHYLWRAVDHDGHVLDILMQSQRNRQAAKRFFRKLQ
ncbi:DDE-type integrase/transposase/recombinase [Glaciimonas sp. GG7]